PEGRKELVGFTDGIRESSQSWRDLLLDFKRRGLTTAPQIAVADGALGFWKGTRRGVADNPRATLLGAQDRQHPEQDAKEPAQQGQARAAGDLDGRNQEGCRCGIGSLCRNLPDQLRESCRLPDQGPRCATGVLRLPCRALEALANDEPH